MIYVDPSDIVFQCGEFNNNPFRYDGRFSLAYYAGSEVRGDWDKDRTKISELPKYRSIKQRYKEGRDWCETDVYQHLLSKIEERGKYDGCENKEDIIRRYEQIDQLYESIRTEGFKEVGKLDHVTVNIARDGEIVFNGSGHHRLSIAKILGIDEIPVRVLVRHRKWQRVRNQITSASTCTELSETIVDNRSHPDLEDLVEK
ncbi:hypothetical protein D8S78_20680 [Natrialba swarupiae]|nr:hypothetical protein [Natrialba swarupiae]